MATSNIQNVNSATIYTSQFTPQAYAASFTYPWATTPNVSVAVTGAMTLVAPSGVPINGEFQLLLTNTSGSAKTITFSAGWVDGDGNTLLPITLQNNGSSLLLLTTMSATIVSASVSGSGSGATVSKLISQTAHGFVVGDWLYVSGASTYAKSANTSAVLVETIGVVSQVVDANSFKIVAEGYVSGLTGLTAGSAHFISGTPGAITAVEPAIATSYRKAVFIGDTTTSGWVKLYPATPIAGQSAVVNSFNSNDSTTNTGGTGIQNITLNNSTNMQTVAPAANRVVISNNAAGSMQLSGSTVVVPVAGNYQINASLTYEPSTINVVFLQIVKNGVTVLNASGTNSSAGDKQVSALAYNGSFAVGDVIDIRVDGNAGSAARIFAYSLSIVQVGASPVPLTLVGEFVAPVYAAANVNPTAAQTSSATAVQFMAISVPTAGTWEIEYSVRGASNQGAVGASGISAGLYDGTGAFLANSEIITNFWSATTANSQSTGTRTYTVVTNGAATFSVKVWNSAATTLSSALTDNNGRSYIRANKISGFTPSSGQTVDFIKVNLTANTAALALNAAIPFDQTESGNVLYNSTTGQFTLSAGKTYELRSNIAGATSNSVANFQWFNVTSGLPIGNMGENDPTNVSSVTYGLTQAEAIITPAVLTVVELRNVLTASRAYKGGVAGTAPASSATIRQLGSSSVVAGLYPGTWGTYVPAITAVTTNPVKPTSGIVIDTASYLVEGKRLTVNYTFWIGTAAGQSVGAGTYKFSLPPGFVIDTSKVTTIASVDPTLAAPNIANILGTVQVNRGSQAGLNSQSLGHVYAADANTVTASFMLVFGAHVMFDSNIANAGLQSGIGWKMQFTVPIV